MTKLRSVHRFLAPKMGYFEPKVGSDDLGSHFRVFVAPNTLNVVLVVGSKDPLNSHLSVFVAPKTLYFVLVVGSKDLPFRVS